MQPVIPPSTAPQRDSASFRFEGREIPIADGATIAAALVRAGEMRLRHAQQGDCRGLFCGMGVCSECLVIVDGRPGQRACMTAARAGMSVARQPARPQLRAESPASQPAPRSDAAESAPIPGDRTRDCDLLVVGGGPAGLTAAALAAEHGLDVVLLDERAKLGGQYFKQPAGAKNASGPPPDAQFAAGRALIQRALTAGVDVHTGVQVWAAFAPDDISAIAPDGRRRYAARALVLAPGAYERGLPLPGWTLPGVMTTGAAQTLWRSYGTPPGRRILVSGNGPLNMQVAAELTRSGATVVGLAELARPSEPGRALPLARMALADPRRIREGIRYRAALARARVPVMYGSAVVRVEGDEVAQSAVVMEIDGQGRPRPGTERAFAVDAVCMGFGFIPSTELARSLGCRHEHSAEAGHLVTVVDERGGTSQERVWVVGDGAGIRGAWHAQAQGALAAIDVARALGVRIDPLMRRQEREAQAALARYRRFQGAMADVFGARLPSEELASAETCLCRCEGVTRAAVERALLDDPGHIGAVKRATRAGMGPCQGRYCAPVIAAMIARRTGEPLGELSGFAPSPPVKPVEIGELLAGHGGELRPRPDGEAPRAGAPAGSGPPTA